MKKNEIISYDEEVRKNKIYLAVKRIKPRKKQCKRQLTRIVPAFLELTLCRDGASAQQRVLQPTNGEGGLFLTSGAVHTAEPAGQGQIG